MSKTIQTYFPALAAAGAAVYCDLHGYHTEAAFAYVAFMAFTVICWLLS